MSDQGGLYTVPQVGETLGLSASAVRRLLKQGRLDPMTKKAGRRYAFTDEDLENARKAAEAEEDERERRKIARGTDKDLWV